MIDLILSVIAIIISIGSLLLNVYMYVKSLPKLSFIFYSSRYHMPLDKKRHKLISDYDKFNMEILAINSGEKEISIIDIFPPIKEVSEIKVYKEDNSNPIYLRKNYSKKEFMEEGFGRKEHIPIKGCQRLRIELSLKLKSNEDGKYEETSKIWNDVHNKDFIFVTSDRRKYKVNASKILMDNPIVE